MSVGGATLEKGMTKPIFPNNIPPKIFPKDSTTAPEAAALVKSSIARLPASSLAEICRHVRVQLIQQRLPLICPACRPHVIKPLKQLELNLTRMLRDLCPKCKMVFIADTVPTAASNAQKKMTVQKISQNNNVTSSPSPPASSSLSSSSSDNCEENSWTVPLRKIILRVTSAVLNCTKIGNSSPSKANAKEKALRRNNRPDRKLSNHKTYFETLTDGGSDWCRYCGTTESSTWHDTPLGCRTLCESHGTDYIEGKLTLPSDEIIRNPFCQNTCSKCYLSVLQDYRRIFPCHACPRAYHTACFPTGSSSRKAITWFCSDECRAKLGVPKPREASSHRERFLSVPTPHRYAKRFHPLFEPIPSPPPTPSCPKTRKRRATVDPVNDIMICFDTETVAKRPSIQKPTVFTPHFQDADYPPSSPLSTTTCNQSTQNLITLLKDETMLQRHSRYEEVEKKMRLCRPEVLRSLYEGSPASIICSSFADDSESS